MTILVLGTRQHVLKSATLTPQRGGQAKGPIDVLGKQRPRRAGRAKVAGVTKVLVAIYWPLADG
jgi:hypothetical protein